MVKHAVILIPEGRGRPPDFFLAPVAGLPLLYRQIYSLWRAGVAKVTVLACPAAGPGLLKGLARLAPRDTVAVASDWETIWQETPQDEDSPRLMLLAEVFPLPRVFKEFVRLPLAPHTVALAIIQPAAAPRLPEGPVQPVYQASVEDSVVRSLTLSLSWEKPWAAGLALFSPEAWQGFQDWEKADRQRRGTSLASPENLLFGFLFQKVAEEKVIAVCHSGTEIMLIRQERDFTPAGAWLVAATEGSPWGEGFLEKTANRYLAHKILPHLLTFPLTPNQITGLDLLVGLGAVALFSQGTYWANVTAAWLLLLVMLLDTLDGLVARLTFRESPLGAKLDLYGDTVLNFLVFAGIALGQYRSSGHHIFLWTLIPLTLGYWGCWKALNPLRAVDAEPRPLRPAVPLKAPASGLKDKLRSEATSRDFFTSFGCAPCWTFFLR